MKPYTYYIRWTKINKHYYGVKYSKNANPDTFWKDYFTSSKYVKEMREKYGEPDVKQVRKVFTCGESAKAYESKVILRLGATQREEWLNRGNPGGSYVMNDATRMKISESSYGKKQSEYAKQVASKTHKGKKLESYHKDALLDSITGKKNYQYQPFTLHVKQPNGEIIDYLFEGLLKCSQELGIQGKWIKHMKDGGEYPITLRSKAVRHPFPKGSVITITLH